MALIQCSECNHDIAKSAKACPHCGAPNRQRTGRITRLVFIALTIVLTTLFIVNKSWDDLGFDSRREVAGIGRDGAEEKPNGSKAAATGSNAKEPPARKNWQYPTQVDEISGKRITLAQTKSANKIEFGFPYAGLQQATLTLRQHPRWGNDVILSIERGQFLCSTDCKVTARFDNGMPTEYSATEPQDASTTSLFVRSFPRFMSSLRKAKQLRIETQFFQEGTRILTFAVTDLEWEVTQAEKSHQSAIENDAVLEAAKRDARTRCRSASPDGDAIDELNCEMAIGDCMRSSAGTSARARCLSLVPATDQ